MAPTQRPHEQPGRGEQDVLAPTTQVRGHLAAARSEEVARGSEGGVPGGIEEELARLGQRLGEVFPSMARRSRLLVSDLTSPLIAAFRVATPAGLLVLARL